MNLLLRRGAIGSVIGALFGLTALALGYARDPALTLEMDRSAAGIVSGLYDAERAGRDTFAWTRRTATMTLRELDRGTEWACTIRLRGGRADESTLPEVVITVDGLMAAAVQTTNEYQDVAIALPARPDATGATVTLTVSNTFVPGPSDRRTLGVVLDRWACRPASTGFLAAPRAALTAAAVGGAAFGASFALIGAGILGTVMAAVVLAAAQAVPLGWELGPYTAYPVRAAWLAVGIAALLVLSVRATQWSIGRPLSGAARIVVACTAAVLYLKLLALLHPAKPPIDVIFHAHRLQWVLEGRFYFTQPMPSGVRFPYAIGLYVFAAPWTLLTSDYVLLLRIIVSTAEAAGAVLMYLLISRMWSDRLAGVLAALLFHLVPRTYEIVGNANMTNAFGQSVALMALSAAVLWPLQRSDWRQAAALTGLTALALLSHISTFTLLGGILLALAVMYWIRGGRNLRHPALSVLGALIIAAGLSVAIYYGHFGEAYRTAARVRAAPAAAVTDGASRPDVAVVPGSSGQQIAARVGVGSKVMEAARLTIAAVGWPIFVMAVSGILPLWRRGFTDRLSLAVLALLTTFLLFVLSVVAMPVERSFQRYAAEFISRVTLATYPALVILAGAGLARAYRAAWPWRLVATGLMLGAIYVGVDTWLEWLR